MKGNAECMS